MAIGIQTRRASSSRLREWGRQHRVALASFLGVFFVAAALALSSELRRPPLERTLRSALDHTLRGADYTVSLYFDQSGPVLIRQPRTHVLVCVFQGQPPQLEAARQVVEGLVSPARGDQVRVVATPYPPPRSLWFWWCAAMGGWSLACLGVFARKQCWWERARRAWRLRRPPAPSPAAPEVVPIKAQIDIGPGFPLNQLGDCIDRVRATLLEELGFRLPPVRLRQHKGHFPLWEIRLRDRLVHRYDPGSFRTVESFLVRTFRELAGELTGIQEVDEMVAPVLKIRADLRHRFGAVELTTIFRSLLQHGTSLVKVESILARLVELRDQNPRASLEKLSELLRGER